MWFLSRYDHSIDSKNRLLLPAAHRKALELQELGSTLIARAVLGRDPESNLKFRYVELTPQTVFEKLSAADATRTHLVIDSKEAEKAYRVFGSSHLMELDDAGRILLTDRFVNRTGKEPNPRGEKMLQDEVSIVGMGTTIQLWNAKELLWYDKRKLELTLGESLSGWDNIMDEGGETISQG
jgi:DNA-binding transcriptional regulator/RsmH inhibitor MraZ